MENKKPLPSRKLRLRLIFAIPVTVFLFAIATGILAFYLVENMTHNFAGERLLVAGKIFLMAIVAFGGGLLLAYGVTQPLKQMARRGEEILPPSPPSAPRGNEISDLSQVFDRISFSLDQFVRDHQILENLKEGLITLDQRGAVYSFNKVAEKFFGTDLKDQFYWEILARCPENTSFLGRIERALRSEEVSWPHEEKIKTLKGQEFTFWVSLAPIEQPKGIMISFKDLQEVRYIRSQIRRTQTLAELGGLTSTLTHEIRNPLGSVRGLLEFLAREIPAGDGKKTFVDRALQEIDRLSNLTDDFLDLLHAEHLTRQPGVDINGVLQQTLSLARHELSATKFAVEERYAEDLPDLEANPERLTQAFLNIILNALQAMPDGGKLVISSERQPSAVSVSFWNSGSYISPEAKEKLFQPFYTTKPKGTGFGLFLSQKIVAAHRGKIEVESDAEKGTTFRVELPLSDGGSGA